VQFWPIPGIELFRLVQNKWGFEPTKTMKRNNAFGSAHIGCLTIY
jgi:hypothetical protein